MKLHGWNDWATSRRQGFLDVTLLHLSIAHDSVLVMVGGFGLMVTW